MSSHSSEDEELISRRLADASPARMPADVAARLQAAIVQEAEARAAGDSEFEVEITQRTRAKTNIGTFGDNPLTRVDALGKQIRRHQHSVREG